MTSKANSSIKLPRCESFIYFSLWTGAVLYSVYNVYLINTYFDHYDDLYGDFTPGWSWIGRKRDISDQEWRVWIPLLMKLAPWIFFHHFISQTIKTIINSMLLLCCWYIIIAITFSYFYIGTLGMLCILIQPFMLYILTYKRSRSSIWLINILCLFVIHFLKIPDGTFQNMLQLSDEEHYILIVTMCWIQLRSISFSLDNTKTYLGNTSDDAYSFSRNLLYKLAYCLYLPTLFLGPLVLYHEFITSVNQVYDVLSNVGNLVFNLVRYIFWIFFANFFLHFLYFNAVQYHPEFVRSLNPWALYGLGYCLGQFFLIKYVVVYGLNHTLCAIDCVKAPPQPKCVARIHLYSDMWKYFDQGLYKFLVRYIYVPLLKSNFNKLIASFLCFTFVFIWHGMQTNIFIWAFMNFIGLNVESSIKSAEKSKCYLNVHKKYISRTNARRLNCILTSPLLAVSVISNFYFFAGDEIGHIYTYKILHGTILSCTPGTCIYKSIQSNPMDITRVLPCIFLIADTWYTTFILLFFLYCCCQVSIDIKSWELKRHSSLKH